MRMETLETRTRRVGRKTARVRKTTPKSTARTKAKTAPARKAVAARANAKMKVKASAPKTRQKAPAKKAASAKAKPGAVAGAARTTLNHEKIQKWAEKRGGAPASVRGTGKGKGPGVLRIDFPGYTGEDKLRHISWDEWFDKFEESKLAFLYQDKTKSGKESRFFKLVQRKK